MVRLKTSRARSSGQVGIMSWRRFGSDMSMGRGRGRLRHAVSQHVQKLIWCVQFSNVSQDRAVLQCVARRHVSEIIPLCRHISPRNV